MRAARRTTKRRAVARAGLAVADAISAYLPLVLMALLALGTWWLVLQSPAPQPERPQEPPRHVPDYTMSRFTVLRYAPDGRLAGRVEGEQLHHFPDTDTIEVEQPRIRAIAADGRVLVATADRAVGNANASQLELNGAARVIREATAAAPAIDFRGEYLHADFQGERLRSHLPVVVRRGTVTVRAAAFEYDHGTQRVELKGAVRAEYVPRPAGR